jgi:hypothetical protein
MSTRDMASFARHLEQARQREEDERTARYAAVGLVGAMAPRATAAAAVSDKSTVGTRAVSVQVRGPSGYLHQCEPLPAPPEAKGRRCTCPTPENAEPREIWNCPEHKRMWCSPEGEIGPASADLTDALAGEK